MKTLLTGVSGFLGKAIMDKTSVFTCGLGRTNSEIICDLVKEIPQLPNVAAVIHAAGKAHIVPKNAKEKDKFFDVNVRGTSNLLKGLEISGTPKTFVFISSVAVYGKEFGTFISESSELGAKDPYGKSKIQAEELIQEWCSKHNVVCTILRLPLLAGKNPPGNLGAMINGIKKGYYFNVGAGRAKKSMVMAEDVATAIVRASEVGGVYNLTDGYHPSFFELSNRIAEQLNKAAPKHIPDWMARMIAKAGDFAGPKFPIDSTRLSKISADLTFDDSKARAAFGWNPQAVLEAFEV